MVDKASQSTANGNDTRHTTVQRATILTFHGVLIEMLNDRCPNRNDEYLVILVIQTDSIHPSYLLLFVSTSETVKHL